MQVAFKNDCMHDRFLTNLESSNKDVTSEVKKKSSKHSSIVQVTIMYMMLKQ